jgi:hypothetical protein
MQEINALDHIRMDKSAFSTDSLDNESDEKLYWLSRTPVERIHSVEIMRQIFYGYNPLTTRLQRFFEIAELP